MLSFHKTFTTFPSQIPRTFQRRYASSCIIKSSSDNGNNIASEDDLNASPPVQRPITPPGTVEIRFRRGSRKRRKQQQDGVADKMQSKQAPIRKDWDSMTLSEKAIELYVGEKGALYWLNKFAYASIFIVIGGWILFRLVGPALNLYQLDAPPLSPTSMFKG
ncbi:hypothetical protein CDL12_21250 [Handroanthus impetiginosus]|uniref:Uncharacterized protein n=1 Tax=Handroanthus impetiginosus TaxID=429701 RepID=A0A2G9GLW3_9LAMI|nr:hypothetical protein CDL12_21250 [Handroanthus impetiginosus]